MLSAISFKPLAIASPIIVSAFPAPTAQATTVLTGHVTTGGDMAGASVTVSFLDGNAQTLIWDSVGTAGNEGGVFSDLGWSLTQRLDSFDFPWTLTADGSVAIASLTIDLVGGNAAFDSISTVQEEDNTEGSKKGREFEVVSGPAPDSVVYSTPIDISQGDLFGSLTLGWDSGFRGSVLEFLADTDSGTQTNPVSIAQPVAAEPDQPSAEPGPSPEPSPEPETEPSPEPEPTPVSDPVVAIEPEPTTVPEPGALLGMLAIAGLGRRITQRR